MQDLPPALLDWSDKALLFMIDQLSVINAETDQFLGVKTTLQWQPIGLLNPALTSAMGSAANRYERAATQYRARLGAAQLRVD